jgi:hypothetical protein
MPSIEIDRAPAGGGPTVVFRPCDGVEIVVSMPYTTVVFGDADFRGLHQGSVDGPTFIVARDGTFEFDDKKAVEINTIIPRRMAQDLFDALGPLVGQKVTRDIAANAEGEAGVEDPGSASEDPQGAGRSRVKKQARRTQRKRRNPKRK